MNNSTVGKMLDQRQGKILMHNLERLDLSLEICAEDIALGKQWDIHSCPVALSAKRCVLPLLLPDEQVLTCSAGPCGVFIYTDRRYLRGTTLPSSLLEFIYNYDRDVPVSSISASILMRWYPV